MNVLITSGGTKVPIDDVRDITNKSKGTFGSKLAEEFINQGHNVTLLRSEDSKSPFSLDIDFYKSTLNYVKLVAKKYEWCENHHRQYSEIIYKNYFDYAKKLESLVKNGYDATILVAAVSDYVTTPMHGKVRSDQDLNIKLSTAEKLISKVKEWDSKTYLVGFKLLVGASESALLSAALKSIENNKCDLVVANDLNVVKTGSDLKLLVKKDRSAWISTNTEKLLVKCIVDKGF